MTEAEMNSYRFNSGKEPSDEMLTQIMREAAQRNILMSFTRARRTIGQVDK